MNYLLSYNHSGNTWVRYCIEYLSQLPTHGHKAFSISERKDNFLNVDLEALPVLIKRHKVNYSEINIDDKIVLLIRNPNECIKKEMCVNAEFKKYYELITFYERFKGQKKFYKFDSLFDANTILDIADFFKIPLIKKNVKHFTNIFEYHKKQSLSIYQNKTGHEGAFIPQGLLNYVRDYL